MSLIIIAIAVGNEAMSTNEDIGQALKTLGTDIKDRASYEDLEEMRVLDINGNLVGRVQTLPDMELHEFRDSCELAHQVTTVLQDDNNSRNGLHPQTILDTFNLWRTCIYVDKAKDAFRRLMRL